MTDKSQTIIPFPCEICGKPVIFDGVFGEGVTPIGVAHVACREMPDKSQTTKREPDKLAVRHLIVALERMTAGRLEDAQLNIEYARARLATQTGSYLPNPDLGEDGNFS